MTIRCGSERETFSPSKISVDPDELSIPLSAVDDIVPVLDRIGPQEWLNEETGDVLDLQEVLTEYRDEFPPEVYPLNFPNPEWLQKLLGSVAVRFIDTERLTGKARRSRRRIGQARIERTVRLFSQELASQVNDSIAKYGALSQSLDRTFPSRLVTDGGGADGSVETLQKRSRRNRTEALTTGRCRPAGGEQAHIEIPDLARVDESQRGVLAVYAKDTMKKLGVFDELFEKVSTFREMANSRFRHKRMTVNEKGINVVTDEGRTLDLERLSSGEQHELVILYELLFRTKSNSLILIDEPELSLHVLWQEQFVKDLRVTAGVSNFRAIIATHSPEIIGDRWDLTVELSGPNGD